MKYILDYLDLYFFIYSFPCIDFEVKMLFLSYKIYFRQFKTFKNKKYSDF